MKKQSSELTSTALTGRHVATTLAAAVSFAALSNQSDNAESPLGVAACTFSIDIEQPWQQILPGADFAAYDGRPTEVPGNKWRIDNAKGEALAAKLNARAVAGEQLLVDYDHQTLLAKENGSKAPASAWGNKFEWREDKGLFAQLNFTPTARKHIKDGEYKYYSPVVIYNKHTGEVLDLHSAALTNDPAVKGMSQAAALHANVNNQPSEPTPMNEALALLFNLLGITTPSTDIDAAALHAQLTKPGVKAKLDEIKSKLDGAAESDQQIAALTAKVEQAKEGINPAEYVPIKTYNGVVAELAALSANHSAVTVDQLIEQAQKDGKFVAQAELPYLRSLGKSSMAALKAQLDGRATVEAFGGKQTKEKKPDGEDQNGVAALTADQKLVADQLGISHEDYATELKKD